MIDKLRATIYSKDVWRALSFWQYYFAAKLVEQVSLTEAAKGLVVQLVGGAELCLMPRDYLPDEAAKLADVAPALTLFCQAGVFSQLQGELTGASAITENTQTQAFSFRDPDGHTFVVAARADNA